MPESVLIIGATSAIARATAHLFASERARMYLVGRSPRKLAAVVREARERGADEVGHEEVDLADFTVHGALIGRATDFLGTIDVVLMAHGAHGDEERARGDYAEAERILRLNFSSVVSLLTPVANLLERQGRGRIAVISSIVGDRGKSRYHFYGTAKAALNFYLDGLRNRLFPAGVTVTTIKPGHVDTPMTAHVRKGRLFVRPETVARRIHRAIRGGRDVVYAPGFWWGIMATVRLVPEWCFKRLRFEEYPGDVSGDE